MQPPDGACQQSLPKTAGAATDLTACPLRPLVIEPGGRICWFLGAVGLWAGVRLEEYLAKVGRALKLMLWIQFLRQRHYGLLVRFYTGIWLSAVAVAGTSVAMLLWADRPTQPHFVWLLVVSACPLIILVAYGFARFIPLLVVAMSVLIPGIMTIAPVVSHTTTDGDGTDAELPSYMSTGDVRLFFKGAGACTCLMALTFLLQAVARLPHAFSRKRRWPLRRAATLVLLTSGLVGLEVLRVSLRLVPSFQPPWSNSLATFMAESGWPYAVAFWLWLNVAYLLAWYDARLIPYLLRRSGHPWAPNDLSVTESHLVDELLLQFSRHREAPRRRENRRLENNRLVEKKRSTKKLSLKKNLRGEKKRGPKKKPGRGRHPPERPWPDDLQ